MTTPPPRVVVAQSVEPIQSGLTGEGQATFIADLRANRLLARLQSSATMSSNGRLASNFGTKSIDQS
jgi:hypothetical protein